MGHGLAVVQRQRAAHHVLWPRLRVYFAEVPVAFCSVGRGVPGGYVWSLVRACRFWWLRRGYVGCGCGAGGVSVCSMDPGHLVEWFLWLRCVWGLGRVGCDGFGAYADCTRRFRYAQPRFLAVDGHVVSAWGLHKARCARRGLSCRWMRVVGTLGRCPTGLGWAVIAGANGRPFSWHEVPH